MPVGVRNSDHPCDLRLRPKLAAGQRRANRALSRARAGHLPANRMWMKSQSDALRSSPGVSACPRPQGKATEGRMFASVAPREVLARLRRGVAKPQVKPLIGVSDCRGRKRLIRHAATPWYSLISPPSSSRRSIWRMGLGVEKTPIVAGA
jgi:hypothetical protein